ncbi:MAG: hypothetical protein H8D87_10450 [Deltaproteobacteria bacterium]|nr:hypothetical protein [Candidatus Desulfobacula maris]
MGEKLDLIIPLPDDALKTGKSISKDSDVLLIKNPHQFPLSKHVMNVLDVTASSVLFLILRSKDKMVGNVIFHSVGEPKFTESHLGLVESLKDPMKIAMSNALKHREVLKLRDLLADDNKYLHGELRRLSGDEIIGANFGLKDVMKKGLSPAPCLKCAVDLKGQIKERFFLMKLENFRSRHRYAC